MWVLNYYWLYVYYCYLFVQYVGFKNLEQKFSLSFGVGLILKCDILGLIWIEVLWGFVWMILGCGGLVFLLFFIVFKWFFWKFMMFKEQIEELVCYGGEFQKFVSLLSGYIGFIDS